MSFLDPNQPPFSPMDFGGNRPTNVDFAGDYTESKPGLGKIYKENAVATGWQDEEPLITPQKLRDIHLFGIPLVSNVRDPLTNRPAIMTDDLLKQFILEAVSLGQAESKIDIFPTQYVEKQAFDRAAYDQFGYFLLRHRPVTSIEAITVTPSNEVAMFKLPLEWVEVGLLHLGQVNLIPLTIATRGGTMVPLTSGPGGTFFLSLLQNRPWVPSMFEFIYTTGFKEGALPKVINQYLGCIAAMEILSLLATTYSRNTSTSLGIDGLSQSIGGPGGQIYKQRLEELGSKRKWLLGRIQAATNTSFIIDNI
jgi:hypothetical protein